METLTWEKLTENINSWLSFKRKVAESTWELPTLDDVCKYTLTAIVRYLEDADIRTGRQRMLNLTKKYHLDVKSADIQTITMIDVQTGNQMPEMAAQKLNGHDEAAVLIQAGSWAEGVLNPIFQWAVLNRKVDEMDIPTSVVIITDRPQADVWGAAQDALRYQRQYQSTGRDVIARWAQAPYDFRVKHIICPNCGSSFVEMMSFATSDQVGCDSCHWRAQSRLITSKRDLANGDLFREERDYLFMKHESEREVQQTLSGLKALSSKLNDLVGPYRKLNPASLDMVKELKNIVVSLENAATAFGR